MTATDSSFALEAYNVLNHPNQFLQLGGSNDVVGNGVQDPNGNPVQLPKSDGQRSVQLAGKFTF